MDTSPKQKRLIMRRKFTKAAQEVLKLHEGWPTGACGAMKRAGVSHTWEGIDYLSVFRMYFRPYHFPSWYWPPPRKGSLVRLGTGLKYDPQEARCMALLLMAEMIRTGDI